KLPPPPPRKFLEQNVSRYVKCRLTEFCIGENMFQNILKFLSIGLLGAIRMHCPLNSSQNVATVTTDYTLASTSESHEFTIKTAGDYLIFINTTSASATIRAGVFN
ncbi:MAG: hypothetical protein O9301_12105, partial [Leptospira sp.]|nr:hypothetical protein [Leptospira sp.]